MVRWLNLRQGGLSDSLSDAWTTQGRKFHSTTEKRHKPAFRIGSKPRH